MSNETLTITGKLFRKYPTEQISERFKKREFVIDLTKDDDSYPNYPKIQLAQNRCELLDFFNEGDAIKVSFNIKGNRWEKDGKENFITSIDAWRIEKA